MKRPKSWCLRSIAVIKSPENLVRSRAIHCASNGGELVSTRVVSAKVACRRAAWLRYQGGKTIIADEELALAA